MNTKTILSIFKRFKTHNPTPTTELNYTTPFELLIAVVLSAQCTDTRVNLVTKELFALANTPEAIVKLGEEKLRQLISSINLYNNKAKNIFKLSQQIIECHQGEVPEDRISLEALPGVGRKSANVLLNTAFGQNTIAVDTHIFRVANRLGIANGKTPLAVEKQLNQIVPKLYIKNAHHWLLLHGRYICVARKPKCKECFLVDLCNYPYKTN